MKGRNDCQFRHPGEKKAWEYLETKKKHKLLRHNFHAGFAEIDLITVDPEFLLHAIEVKSWKKESFIHPVQGLGRSFKSGYPRAFKKFLSEACDDSSCLQILETVHCDRHIQDLSVSFDLIWCQKDGIVYFDNLI